VCVLYVYMYIYNVYCIYIGAAVPLQGGAGVQDYISRNTRSHHWENYELLNPGRRHELCGIYIYTHTHTYTYTHTHTDTHTHTHNRTKTKQKLRLPKAGSSS